MRRLIFHILVAAAAVVGAVAAKVGLETAVAPTSWFIVTFVAVLLVAWLVGPTAGLATAVGIALVELVDLVGPPRGEGRLAEIAPAAELVSGLLAALTGTAMRVASARERRSLATAERATRSSEHLDRRWHVVTASIPEFATLATPLQVEDALVRHATELVGRPMRLDSATDARDGGVDGDAVTLADEAGVVGVLRPDVSGSRAPEQPTQLSGPDRVGLIALATLAGSALDRIRLRSATGSSVAFAERSGERLRRLHQLTVELAALVTPESIGEVVVRHVLDVLNAPVGLFYLTDAAGDLRLAHSRGYPIGLAGHDARLSPDQGLPVGDSVRDARPVIVASPAEWRRMYPGASDRLGITGTKSLVAWPIGSPPNAALVVQRAVEGAPSADELSQIQLAAHQAVQAIERARIYAQEREARQLQEAFVGVMSHELRTPITTILAGSKLLTRDRTMRDRSRDIATDIEAEADRLFRLVEDLLVLSRLERGSLSVGDEPVHLARVLSRVAGSEATRWPDMRFELPDDRAGHLVRGDETYVEQVLRNLLTNAAKYSPPGSLVRVQVDATESDVAVRVLDQGPGVTEAEVERLFGLFYRSPTTAASAAGAGIGLFVCRRLVAAMGGRIWARSRPAGGSEFGFSLAPYPDDDVDRSQAAPSMDDRRDGRATLATVPAGGQTVDNVSPT